MDEDLDDCSQRYSTHIHRFLEVSRAYLGLRELIARADRVRGAPAEGGSMHMGAPHASLADARVIDAAHADPKSDPLNGVEPWSRSSMPS
jgi:hypothetical protein